jgi:hypothetical protein
MAKEREIIWRGMALIELDKLFAWIEKDSIQNAEKIADLIIEKVDRLEFNPNSFLWTDSRRPTTENTGQSRLKTFVSQSESHQTGQP